MSGIRILSPLVLSLALGLAAGAPALAQDATAAPAPGAAAAAQPDGHQGRWLDRMAMKLNLTDAQKAKVKAIFAQHRDSLMAQGKAVREARQAFRAAMAKPETSADTLKGLHDTLAQAQIGRILEARALRQEVRAVLTPEQREQAARMEGRMEGMRMARFGCGGARWNRGSKGMQRGPQGPGMMPAPDGDAPAK